MSDFETDTTKPSSLEKNTVDASRRKLTAAMLAGPVVLSTLASKQALGQAFPYRCTVSGQISDTDSARPAGQACNTFGQPPSYWNGRINCWTTLACTPFNAIFTGSSKTIPMGALINDACSVGATALERAAIATYLNATYFFPNYPLSQPQVLELFQSPPDGLDPLLYFQSLYGGEGPDLANCTAAAPPECNAWGDFCTASTAPAALKKEKQKEKEK